MVAMIDVTAELKGQQVKWCGLLNGIKKLVACGLWPESPL